MSKRRLPALLPLAALSLVSLVTPIPTALADGVTIAGTVRKVDASRNLLTIRDQSGAARVVDMNAASVSLDGRHSGDVADLQRGMQVEVTGTPDGDDRFAGRSVRILNRRLAGVRSGGLGSDVLLTGTVSSCDASHASATITNGYGRQITVDYIAADLAAPGASGAGSGLALAPGQRVLVRGSEGSGSRVIAERVSILSDGTAGGSATAANVTPVVAAAPPAFHVREDTPIHNDPTATSTAPPDVATLPAAPTTTAPPAIAYSGVVPPSPDPAAVMASLDSYTGLLIDARHLTKIARSPAPNILGPAPGNNLLYPDRSHVPTPDQVQDESIVRYFHTEAEAEAGEVGPHPLILPAQALRGNADDSVELSAQDMALLLALDNKLHFTQSWKVGFLIPGNE